MRFLPGAQFQDVLLYLRYVCYVNGYCASTELSRTPNKKKKKKKKKNETLNTKRLLQKVR